ncbi:lipoamide acyltransferase component of branched-chain alpha-keto acid dehydrogenase complex, mitochondrial [Diachasma alloeum]|uniref:lipoamide acyltransferase component of branched-chain alpha-keto acid dehydrogenase complex, mitochondrial n=1 Tax=Diachasma alloeum TaxID=454923 RepID=UPI0007382515|nr:lipoamide acyltransferase component of branched-chain alpha-keto acid dehydrogenase complex, mitochondrial [Diachasma alloeum]
MVCAGRFSFLIKLRPQSRLFCASTTRHGTIIPFRLSDIGEGIREVTLKEWFVKPGDKVAQFNEICEVQSDKASVTITSRYDGHVTKLHYKVNEVALVGDALVDIELEDGDAKVVKEDFEASEVPFQLHNEIVGDYYDKNGRVLTTPAVRRIAAENNVKLKKVPATGKAGRVLKEDILAFLEKQKGNHSTKSIDAVQVFERNDKNENIARNDVEVVTLKGYQRHMWKTMTQSLSIPHFAYSDECDITKLLDLRNDVKDFLKSEGISLTLMPFFVKAASKALEKYPQLNAWLDEDNQSLKVFRRHNISFAMATPEGLVVPNIKNVQELSITEIAKELNRLQELGKKASLPLSDLHQGTFSLSNIGVVGGTYTKPVILPPQIVIGAFGKVQKVPRFDFEGNTITANIIFVSWAADHRVVDGVTMAQFSNLWKHYVENPSHLLV